MPADEKNDTPTFSTVSERVMKADADYVMHTYGRYPVEFVSGHDATLVDSTGREYLDLLGGIGCASLGHRRRRHPRPARARLADEQLLL